MILSTSSEKLLKDPSRIVAKQKASLWKDLGNAKETLISEEPAQEEESKAGSPKAKKKKNMVYYQEQWNNVKEIKGETCVFFLQGTQTEIPLSEAIFEIPIQVLMCSDSLATTATMYVKGSKTLESLQDKLGKQEGLTKPKTCWIYNGKKVDQGERISELKVKPGDKLLCNVIGYELKTFKRFKDLDNSRGWNIGTSDHDSIGFIPKKNIGLAGFGMFCARSGPDDYTVLYELFNEAGMIKTERVEIHKETSDNHIQQVFFNADKSPILIQEGKKFGVRVGYPVVDSSTKIYVGKDGDRCEEVDENEKDMFKVVEYGECDNGTSVGTGQIPEIYYAVMDA